MSAVTVPLPPALDELDERTLALARTGDGAACRALVLRYQRPVFALLSRLLAQRGRAALVEDLAQETFLRAFRALPGFDPDGPARLSTWLLTLATRLALDELKSRRPELEPLGRAELVVSPARADELAERRRTADRIALAVEALTPEQRAAFLLREAHGLSYEDDKLDDALAASLGNAEADRLLDTLTPSHMSMNGCPDEAR